MVARLQPNFAFHRHDRERSAWHGRRPSPGSVKNVRPAITQASVIFAPFIGLVIASSLFCPQLSLGQIAPGRGTLPHTRPTHLDQSVNRRSTRGGVLAPESKAAGKDHVDGLVDSLVRQIVQVALRIPGFQVDRRGRTPSRIASRQAIASTAPPAGDEVACHAFGARNRDAIGVPSPKTRLHGQGLDRVAGRGARAEAH